MFSGVYIIWLLTLMAVFSVQGNDPEPPPESAANSPPPSTPPPPPPTEAGVKCFVCEQCFKEEQYKGETKSCGGNKRCSVKTGHGVKGQIVERKCGSCVGHPELPNIICDDCEGDLCNSVHAPLPTLKFVCSLIIITIFTS